VRAAFAAKIRHEGEPKVLCELIPKELTGETVTRAISRGDLYEPGTRTAIAQNPFEIWAPQVINAANNSSLLEYDSESEEVLEQCPERNGHQPSDEYAKQRAGYYAYLKHKYAGIKEVQEDGWVQVYTDGSALRVGNRKQAGAGIFYGNKNIRNRGYEVKGKQTNQRAELTAFLRCIQEDSRRLQIFTDSRYVQLGVTKWMQDWKGKAWFKSPIRAQEIDNVDLWKAVDIELKRRNEPIEIIWVKGHALPHHIKAGLTTEQRIWGNNEADKLAGDAAETLG